MAFLMLVHLTYLNGAIAKNPALLPALREMKYLVWPYTGNDKFDEILGQRLFALADKTVQHYENKDYESAIAMCATAAEMLSYVLFFIYTNSFEIPTEHNFCTKAEFQPLREVLSLTAQKFSRTFGLKGSQLSRLEVLRELDSKDYDSEAIVTYLEKIHQTRIKYTHHWIFIADDDRQCDAESCVTALYQAMGDIFSVESSDEPGTVRLHSNVQGWVQKFNSRLSERKGK